MSPAMAPNLGPWVKPIAGTTSANSQTTVGVRSNVNSASRVVLASASIMPTTRNGPRTRRPTASADDATTVKTSNIGADPASARDVAATPTSTMSPPLSAASPRAMSPPAGPTTVAANSEMRSRTRRSRRNGSVPTCFMQGPYRETRAPSTRHWHGPASEASDPCDPSPHPIAPHHAPRQHDRSGGKRQPQAEDKDDRANSGRHEQGDREAARDRDERNENRDERVPAHAGSSGIGRPLSVPSTRQEVSRCSLSRTMASAATTMSRTRGSTS